MNVIRLKARLWPNIGFTLFGSVHAFGYNSAESEPIWMKSEALSTLLEAGGWPWQILGAVHIVPSSSDSLRGRRNCFCPLNNARF